MTTRKWREAPEDIDIASLIGFCKEHNCYIQVDTGLMGYEVSVVYRIFIQEEIFYEDDLTYAVQLAASKTLEDIKGSGIWANWNDTYLPLHEKIKQAIQVHKESRKDLG